MKVFVKYLCILLLVVVSSCTENKNDQNDSDILNKAIASARIKTFNGFFFVAKYQSQASIFWFDSKSGKYKVFWSDEDEQVIDLLVSPDYSNAYFITKQLQKLKSSKPAIESGRLYRIDFETKKVQPIAKLEEGIQVSCFWIDNDRFTIIVNSIDKTIASYVNKSTQVYNKFGKLLSDNIEIFDLTRDGYPVIKYPELKTTSDNNLFTVSEKNDSIQIIQNSDSKIFRTRFVNKKLKQIGWADNNKILVLLLIDEGNKEKIKNPVTSSLIVYNLQHKKVIKSFEGLGYKRFVLIGDFLIFDDIVGRDYLIKILDLNFTDKFVTVNPQSGCGLRSLNRN